MKTIKKMLILVLAAVMAYSGFRVWNTVKDYKAEADLHDFVMEFKPQADVVINQNVIDLQANYPDVIGWLNVPNTSIDYPFVWYENNNYYLRRDLNGKHATAGTIFMDYRCKKDFTSQNTIIYGHHMKNGSMFGTMKYFADKGFFDANANGTIYLPHATLTLEFFAYMVIKPSDAEIYSVDLSENYFDYVKQNARQYRDIALTSEDKIVTLSTCAYEFDNARMVLLARVQS